MVDLHFPSYSATRPTPVPRPRVARNRPTPSGGTQQTQSSVPYHQQSCSGSDVTREEGDDTTPTCPKTAQSDSTLSNRSDLSHSDCLDSVTSNESGHLDSIDSGVSIHLEFLQKLQKDRKLRKNRELQMERQSKTWTPEIEHDPTSNYVEYLKPKEKAWKEKQLRQGLKWENLEPFQERVDYEYKQKQLKHEDDSVYAN